MSTVLFLSSYYPPTSSAAGIRAQRVCSTLLEMGARVVLITQSDTPAVEELQDNLTIYRVGPAGQLPASIQNDKAAWPRRYILPAWGDLIAYSKAVYRLACRIVATEKPDLIYTSAPPFSLHVAGYRLAEQFGIPHILEFRDLWYAGMYWPYPNLIRRLAAKRWERKCLEQAKKIVVVTEGMKIIFADTYGSTIDLKTEVVRHGFKLPKSTDQKSQLQIKQNRIITLAYTGQLHGVDIAGAQPTRQLLRKLKHLFLRCTIGAAFCEQLILEWMSPHVLMHCLAELNHSDSTFHNRWQLIFAGVHYPEVDRLAAELNMSENIKQLGPVSPEAAQDIARQGDVLILSLYGIKNLEHHWCVPSKIYTYLGLQKPILALVPPGEAADIARQSGLGVIVPPDNFSQIKTALKQLFESFSSSQPVSIPNQDYIRQFDYQAQQKILINAIAPYLQKK